MRAVWHDESDARVAERVRRHAAGRLDGATDRHVATLAREAAELDARATRYTLLCGRMWWLAAVVGLVVAPFFFDSRMPPTMTALGYAAVIGMLAWLILIWVRRQVRISRRTADLLATREGEAGCCAACGYSLNALPAGPTLCCPECGRPAAAEVPTSDDVSRRVQDHLAAELWDEAARHRVNLLTLAGLAVMFAAAMTMPFLVKGASDSLVFTAVGGFAVTFALAAFGPTWLAARRVRREVRRLMAAGAAERTCWHCGGGKAAGGSCEACEAADVAGGAAG